MEMSSTKLTSKIEKLKRMAATIGPEAENANRLINNLIEKYIKDPTFAASLNKDKQKIRVHRLKKYAIWLSSWMGLVVYDVMYAPDFIEVECNSDEYLMFYELLNDLKHIFHKKESELANEVKTKLVGFTNPETLSSYAKMHMLEWKNIALKSYMLGYMTANYPMKKDLCPKCRIGYIVDLVCDKCGTKFEESRYHKTRLMSDHFNEGKSNTTKSIKHKHIMLERKE